jgi:tRNA threonylcarbamoyladenosine modification (KEOPS) complex Cgi121 subunit
LLVVRYMGHAMTVEAYKVKVDDPVRALEEAGLIGREPVQLFDPSKVVSERHLTVAFLCAVDAFATGTNRAKRIEVEFLRFLAGAKQISEAIAAVGVRPGQRTVGVAAFSGGSSDPVQLLERMRVVLGGEPVEGMLTTADPVEVARSLGIPEEFIGSIPESEGVSREELAVLERIAVLRIL